MLDFMCAAKLSRGCLEVVLRLSRGCLEMSRECFQMAESRCIGPARGLSDRPGLTQMYRVCRAALGCIGPARGISMPSDLYRIEKRPRYPINHTELTSVKDVQSTIQN